MSKVFPVLGIAVALLAVTASGQDPPKKPHKIEGSWLAVASSRDGKAVPEEDIAKLQLVVTFTEGKYKVTIKDKDKDREIETGTYKLDETKKPSRLDLTVNKTPKLTRTQVGIFKLDGDKLIVSVAAAGSKFRPDSFEEGEGVEVTTFVRTKKSEESPQKDAETRK